MGGDFNARIQPNTLEMGQRVNSHFLFFLISETSKACFLFPGRCQGSKIASDQLEDGVLMQRNQPGTKTGKILSEYQILEARLSLLPIVTSSGQQMILQLIQSSSLEVLSLVVLKLLLEKSTFSLGFGT